MPPSKSKKQIDNHDKKQSHTRPKTQNNPYFCQTIVKEFELHSERFPLEVAYSYTSRQKAEFISEGDHTLNFVYGHDNHRRKTIYSSPEGEQLEKYFIDSQKEKIALEDII